MLLPPGVAANSGTGDGARDGPEGVDDDPSDASNADAGEGARDRAAETYQRSSRSRPYSCKPVSDLLRERCGPPGIYDFRVERQQYVSAECERAMMAVVDQFHHVLFTTVVRYAEFRGGDSAQPLDLSMVLATHPHLLPPSLADVPSTPATPGVRRRYSEATSHGVPSTPGEGNFDLSRAWAGG